MEAVAMASAALNTTFALFARKLILSGEVIALICMVGWRLDAKLGLPTWPQHRRGLALLSDLLAAGATLALVLFVAFVRDYADIGFHPTLLRYSAECLSLFALITIIAAAALRFSNRSAGLELTGMLASTTAWLLCLDSAVAAWSVPLVRLGESFGNVGPHPALHGLAATLFVALSAAAGLRLRLAKRGSAWEIFLLFGLLALGQGFLAFRGVSALFILAAAGALAWFSGWRMRVTVQSTRVRIHFVRRSGASADAGRRLNSHGADSGRVHSALHGEAADRVEGQGAAGHSIEGAAR